MIDKSKEVSERLKEAMDILDKAMADAQKEVGLCLFELRELKEENDKDLDH